MSGNLFDGPEAVAVWRAAAAHREASLATATALLLDRAGVREGVRVLDIGAGLGDTSLLAAQRVGAGGRVLATEPAADLLQGARDAAGALGLHNVDFQLAGAENFTGTGFDSVIARNSLQFVDDLDATLHRLRGALLSGGRLAAMVWPSADPWMEAPIRALAAIWRFAGEDHPARRPVSLGGEGDLIRTFERSGLIETRVDRVPVVRRFPDAAAARAGMAGAMHTRLATTGLTAADTDRLLATLSEALPLVAVAAGVEVRGAALIVSGRAPGGSA